MENSVEDIEILENWLKELNELFNNTHINNTKERKALEHILSDYKRVLEEFKQVDHECSRLEKKEVKLEKENARLKNKLQDITKGKKVIEEETPQYIKENYILKDKIEEILNETEITDFNSLVEAFLEIKKLLESE